MILNMTGGSGGVQVVEFTVTENYVFDSIMSDNYYVIPNVDILAGGIKGFHISPKGMFRREPNYIMMIASQYSRNSVQEQAESYFMYYYGPNTPYYSGSYANNGFTYDPTAKEVKLKCQEGYILQAARYRMILW